MILGWKTRIGLVLSGVWLCLVFMLAEDHHWVQLIFGVGMLPLVILWGIVWAVSGWRAQRPRSTREGSSDPAKARPRIRSAAIVAACLVVGVVCANWQYRLAGHEGPTPVAFWLGEWMVWGLLSYVAFRAIPRLAFGLAPLFAALVVAGGVNFKAYQTLSFEREVKESIAKAAPLISRIDGGANVSDDEIRRAQLGIFEPLILAKVANTREVLAISNRHESAVAQLEPDQWFTPASLSTSESRQQVLLRLAQSKQEVDDYKAQMESAAARSRLSVKALSAQMPKELGDGVVRGFDDRAAFLAAFVREYAEASNQMVDATAELLTALENAPRSFVIVKGPPQSIQFKDQAALDTYRGQMARVAAAAERIQKARLSLLSASRRGNDELSDFLEKR